MNDSIEVKKSKKSFPWGWVAGGGILFLLFFSVLFFLVFIGLLFGSSTAELGTGNVAVIPITGAIVTQASQTFFSEKDASSADIIEMIKKADADRNIKAIIFEINSPGGSTVPTDEISRAIKNVNKTTVAWVRDVAASGGYWVASSCDVIVANRMSIIGSIGVISSYLDFSGLINRYNVSYERLVSGDYKDMGVPFRELTDDERSYLNEQLGSIHDIFILEIAENRNMSVDDVKKLADGRFFLALQGEKMGLVDILGGKEEAVKYIEDEHEIKAKLNYYKKKQGLFDSLALIMHQGSVGMGKGIVQSIKGEANTKDIYSNGLII